MKRFLSIILAISLVLALLPTFASAAVTTTEPVGTIEYTPATTLTDNTFLAVAYATQNSPSLGISDVTTVSTFCVNPFSLIFLRVV